jgi:hypothetical protein
MNKIEKDFVPYEQALALKELGFNEPCLASYYHAGKRLDIREYINHGEYSVLAPTFSQSFRWFREKGYDVKVEKEAKGLYFGFYWTGVSWMILGNGSYEEEELACLNKLIKLQEDNNEN